MAAEPGVLLLDEPFSSLDLILKQELFATIREVAKGRALVLVTHDPLEALALCHTALVLEDGVAIDCGPIRDRLPHPHSRLLRLFAHHLEKTETGHS
jgi:molybdate transport system ATP-binding protein